MTNYNNVKSLQNCKMKLFYSLQCHIPFKSKTTIRVLICPQVMQKNITGRWNILNGGGKIEFVCFYLRSPLNLMHCIKWWRSDEWVRNTWHLQSFCRELWNSANQPFLMSRNAIHILIHIAIQKIDLRIFPKLDTI